MTDEFRDYEEDFDDSEALEAYTEELVEAVEAFGVPVPPNPPLDEGHYDLPMIEVPQ